MVTTSSLRAWQGIPRSLEEVSDGRLNLQTLLLLILLRGPEDADAYGWRLPLLREEVANRQGRQVSALAVIRKRLLPIEGMRPGLRERR